MALSEYTGALEQAVTRLRAGGLGRVTVVHHNDADGLSSAAVLSAALARAGYTVVRVPLERVHRPINARLHDDLAGTPVIYADLGGRSGPMIAEVNRGRSLTLIVDHHMAEDVDDPMTMNLSSELYGVSGERDISAATAAWFFALALDHENRDLAYLGVIGAIGDSHERGGALIGENRMAMEEAARRSHIRVLETEGREEYVLTRFSPESPLKPLAKALTTLGAAGYAMGGPEIGVRTCLAGPSQEQAHKLSEMEDIKKQRFETALKFIRDEGLIASQHTQWFCVEDRFAPMGVKMIGEFCMEIRNSSFVDPARYIAGFQDMPTEIPGLGEFSWDLVKMSMRVPAPLEEKIIAGDMPGLSWLLPEAARKVNGSIDACHDYAAAALVERGREADIVKALDELVSNRIAHGG